MKYYKIGELSRRLGVTPDFIKYYEKHGLIQSVEGEVCRMYAFSQATNIFECLKLKNYGLSTKEIVHIMTMEQNQEKLSLLLERKKQLQAEILRKQAIVDEIDRYVQWNNDAENAALPYSVRTIDAFYFLKHTETRDFINDPGIYEILNEWADLMPVTKMCCYMNDEYKDSIPFVWGLSLDERDVKNFNVTVNDSCMYIPRQKAVCYTVHDENFDNESIRKIMDEISHWGIELSGELFAVFYGRIKRDDKQYRNGELLFLIKE